MSKVVLVTGSSRGIGKELAISFARNGYDVVINYNGNQKAAEETLEEVSKYSNDSIIIKANVANGEEVEAMFKTIDEHYGHLDVLVNNSGITRDGLLLRMSEEDFMDVININLKGTFLCSKQASKMMMKKRCGSIINMASIVGVMGNAGQCNYAASKAGIIGFTKSLAKELASRNIRVNAIAPGFIDTEMTSVLSDNVKEETLKNIPMKKFGQVKNIADTALFIASDACEYTTGQVFNVNGGMWM
ncbi:MAG: 3-oxoacyl-[acyl-carrier-protein] reductase [Erysipelotrichaceae bacterium]|nr:3-oxoacyl-[acyl-carrier-protein] reductase [Erysipelotrichaceae bacterium]